MSSAPRATGLTVFLTTHYIEETEEADRVCIIDAAGSSPTAPRPSCAPQHSRSVLTVTTDDPDGLIALARAARRVIRSATATPS